MNSAAVQREMIEAGRLLRVGGSCAEERIARAMMRALWGADRMAFERAARAVPEDAAGCLDTLLADLASGKSCDEAIIQATMLRVEDVSSLRWAFAAAVAHHTAETDEEADLRDWINATLRASEQALRTNVIELDAVASQKRRMAMNDKCNCKSDCPVCGGVAESNGGEPRHAEWCAADEAWMPVNRWRDTRPRHDRGCPQGS